MRSPSMKIFLCPVPGASDEIHGRKEVREMIPESFLEELKYRSDIEQIVSPYTNLKRSGRNLTGLCPFHSEKSPSFFVYPENNSF